MSTKRRYRLDHRGKRRLVVVNDETGVEGYIETGTNYCSGCTEYGEYGGRYGPFGCEECGYTGKRRYRGWVPFDYQQWIDKREAIGKDGYLP